MNIAIISKNRDKYSETFIHNQVKHLPFNNHFLYGDYLPLYYGNNQPFIENSLYAAGYSLLKEKLFSIPFETQLKKQITTHLKKNEIKIVLANYAPSGFAMLDVCKESNLPLVVHFHGYTAYRNDIYNNNIEKYKRLFRGAAAIISVSDHMTQRLISIGAPAEKITKIIYGIDSSLFYPSNKPITDNIILYNGRFCDTKNPHLVILAFHQLLKDISDTILVMVGDGDLMPSSVNLAKSLRIEDKIVFRGALSHQEVAEQMRNASVLVQFSATTPNNDTEGTPVSVLEAGLTALPVIVSRSGGLPEVVTHNETGLLVDELDTSGLTNAMKQALLDREKSLEMAARLRTKVLEEYTIERYIKRLSDLLRSVSERKG